MTRRPSSPGLDLILGETFNVLDHGFVRVVDYMGNDEAIVQAARVSYGAGTKTPSDDAALIRYLMRHRHSTPFEMCEIKYHVKLPIFVARQWIRHRTASVNEYSARYSILDKEYYIPTAEYVAEQSRSNKQGRGDALSPEAAELVREILREDAERCYADYQTLLNEDGDGKVIDQGAKGVARELARINLTLNTYTQWYWKIDLHNLLHFLALRTDMHAQHEISAYANTILWILRHWVPTTYAAFVDYRLDSQTLSGPAIRALKRVLAGERAEDITESGMSAREWKEVMAVMEIG